MTCEELDQHYKENTVSPDYDWVTTLSCDWYEINYVQIDA
jgi:hypothetical protein